MNQTISAARLTHSIFLRPDASFFRRAFVILGGVCLLTAASQFSIPLQPVPLTLQTIAVLVISMAYGARYGTSVVLTYLCAGAMGIPVFANFSSGVNIVFTSGYLIGFVPAAMVTGFLAEKGFATTTLRALLTATIGASIIFFFGVTMLASMLNLEKAIAVGLLPFVISEPLKIIAVALIVPRCWTKK